MIQLEQVDDTLHITVSGQLRIAMVYEFTEALMRYADRCSIYCLDLGEVSAISDGGQAVLIMFVNHASQHGKVVRLTGCSREASRHIFRFPILHALLQDTQKVEPDIDNNASQTPWHIHYKYSKVQPSRRKLTINSVA